MNKTDQAYESGDRPAIEIAPQMIEAVTEKVCEAMGENGRPANWVAREIIQLVAGWNKNGAQSLACQ